jgi:hypothetical protein
MVHIRLTDEWHRRMERDARYYGEDLTEYARRAIAERIERSMAQRRTAEEHDKPERDRRGRRGRAEPRQAGMGLRGRFPLTPPEPLPAPEAPAPASPVVVLRDAPSPTDSVAILVEYILSGPKWMRDDRLREVWKILGALPGSPDERKRRVQALEERVAASDGKAPGGSLFDRLKGGIF